nr:integrase, catalytic region, zinc finger, CCHC-type, peptidase aspartic, catalytic [Tanacetum cinerariifolium]
MIGDRSQLKNFVKKFIRTVRFGNDHFGAIMGYEDYVIGDSVIFRGSCSSNLYNISVEDMLKSSPMVNPEGHRLVPDASKLLPLGGDTARTTALSISKLKAANYSDFRLEELVPSLWIKSERDYNISAAYGITHWWFKQKDFYITRHNAPSDHRVIRSHMRILSVISINTFERYGYAFLREIVIRRADYNENIVIRQRVGDLQLGIESYQTKLNLTEPRWDASDFLFKEDYTIVSKPRDVIYRDRNDQKKMLRENENIRVIPKYHGEDGNPARSNIKQALGLCSGHESVYTPNDEFKQVAVSYPTGVLFRFNQKKLNSNYA